jgi:hypothetical protein
MLLSRPTGKLMEMGPVDGVIVLEIYVSAETRLELVERDEFANVAVEANFSAGLGIDEGHDELEESVC